MPGPARTLVDPVYSNDLYRWHLPCEAAPRTLEVRMLRLGFLSFLGLSSALLVTGCGSSGSEVGAGSSSGDFSAPVSGGSAQDPSQQPQTGILTAGVWDDNLNFDIFQSYRNEEFQNKPYGPAYDTSDRIVITVVDEDGNPIPSAQVQINDASHTYLSAPTATDGRVLFFPQHDGAQSLDGLTITASAPAGQPGVQPLTQPIPQGSAWTITLPGAQRQLPKALDLAFVIDATGSMSDELEYLKTEVQGISDAVHASHADVSIRYALIVYRDTGDDYVTRVFDFTSDLSTFKTNLSAQSAEGGGDFPEAMHLALGHANLLSWRGGNTARLGFLVADAPPHFHDVGPSYTNIDSLRARGVKLYPVASSGVDSSAELIMRTGALATLGRYIFLTDDSGVGDPHADPHIPCYQVQKLNTLIARMIASELEGERIPADPAQIIREAGDPVDGVCTLADGTEAYL